MRVRLGIAGVVLAGGLLVACNSTTSARPASGTLVPTPSVAPTKITLAEFNQVADGMSYAQVSQIFGGPGKSIYDSTGSGSGYSYHTQDFTWDAGGGASATVVLQNDKVIQKNQANLR